MDKLYARTLRADIQLNNGNCLLFILQQNRQLGCYSETSKIPIGCDEAVFSTDRAFWIPAFAGMTDKLVVSQPTHGLFKTNWYKLYLFLHTSSSIRPFITSTTRRFTPERSTIPTTPTTQRGRRYQAPTLAQLTRPPRKRGSGLKPSTTPRTSMYRLLSKYPTASAIFIGVVISSLIGTGDFYLTFQRMRWDNPHLYVSGPPLIAYVVSGALIGLFLGIVAAIVYKVVTRKP